MKKQIYTREEVIKLIDDMLQNPDVLIDAVSNENTNWDAEGIIDLMES